MRNRSTVYIAIAVLAAFTINGILVGRALERFKKEDRSISVKGFSEREVKADLAVWTIQCRVAGNDLSEGSKAIDLVRDKVVDFLHRNGIQDSEIIQKDLSVNDKMAQEYGNYDSNMNFRYIIDKIIQVRSNEVDKIQLVSRQTDELLKAGVVLNNRGSNFLNFYFTKLNEIKPEMLSEATKNAKEAAERFSDESSAKIGKLKRANQGLFSIIDRDLSLGQGEGGYYSDSSDLYKKVRVVVSVEYSIE